MKMKELREKSATELDRLLVELRNKVREYRFKVAARQLTDVRDIRQAKKTIAQIMTFKHTGKNQLKA